ncbi:MAG: NADH-quinone oxidoreductase subunit A [Dehalococcoidia bacterium]|nr:NADH-quinone oxidoreductase subunit A [Dehalococcoidia bacterium]
MLAGYGLVALFLIVAIFFTVTMIGMPIMLRGMGIVPSKPNPVKNSIFECGVETIGKSWVRFNFRYYFYALLFIALDVLVIFLYPWAVGLRELGYFGLVAALVFVAIIVVGYVYAWRKKVLEWK